MMYSALYARQSVDKADSISIESQLEYCRYEARGLPCREYADRGYSGKNTNRPAFEQMLRDIRNGEITKVIVYKLDRISRSILDFTNMMEFFGSYGVEFVSSTEKFDTSSPIGRAMLNICIVFAQLERETIQKRVRDSYAARCKKGFYMGGRIPYGFTKVHTTLEGIQTSMYVPVEEEAQQIHMLYSLYADPKNSLSDIVAQFDKDGIKQLRTGKWNTARLSEMLRNPVYVRADAEVYEFFSKQGAEIINPICDFTGYNGCYLYSGGSANNGNSGETKRGKYKAGEQKGKSLVLAPHEGLVSSQIWLACRMRCMSNRQSARTCKGKNSWLAGKVKCGRCGYSLTIIKSHTKWGRYFVCSTALSGKKERCRGTGDTVYAELLEAHMEKAIRDKLKEMGMLMPKVKTSDNIRLNSIKLRIAQNEKEIEELISKVPGAGDTLMNYINDRIAVLDAEKKRLQKEVTEHQTERKGGAQGTAWDPVQLWQRADYEEKQGVLDVLVEEITIADGKIDITWKL